jgi:ATPase subunit of ABC transporter with duplicated ATPase domains
LLIEVKDLEFLIGSNKSQLVSRFKLYQHQRVQIQGPNGRGKSTLLKFIQARLEKGGEFHKDLDQYLRGEINIFNLERQQIFSLQQVTNYPVDYSLESYLQAHTDLMSYHIPNFLKNLELHKFSNHSNLSHLSMGEFIRLQLGVLARIQHTIKLLILDEPGNFLDVFTQKALVHLLQNYTGALLIVSHDPKLVAQIDIEESLELK